MKNSEGTAMEVEGGAARFLFFSPPPFSFLLFFLFTFASAVPYGTPEARVDRQRAYRTGIT